MAGQGEPGVAVSQSSTCSTSGLRRPTARLSANVSNGLMTVTPPNDSRLILATVDFARAMIGSDGFSTRAPMAIAWLASSSPASAISPTQCALRTPEISSTSASLASAISVSGGAANSWMAARAMRSRRGSTMTTRLPVPSSASAKREPLWP